jgi:hypothetical protein
LLGDAELVVASSLTLIECERVLIRAVATNLLPEAAAAERRAVLARTADHWVVFDLDAEVIERARRPFPAEPIRTLDAMHLATALLARRARPAFRGRDGLSCPTCRSGLRSRSDEPHGRHSDIKETTRVASPRRGGSLVCA